MPEDKYAPKPHENMHEVHARHRWLIYDQRNENKKNREKDSEKKTEAE